MPLQVWTYYSQYKFPSTVESSFRYKLRKSFILLPHLFRFCSLIFEGLVFFFIFLLPPSSHLRTTISRLRSNYRPYFLVPLISFLKPAEGWLVSSSCLLVLTCYFLSWLPLNPFLWITCQHRSSSIWKKLFVYFKLYILSVYN